MENALLGCYILLCLGMAIELLLLNRDVTLLFKIIDKQTEVVVQLQQRIIKEQQNGLQSRERSEGIHGS